MKNLLSLTVILFTCTFASGQGTMEATLTQSFLDINNEKIYSDEVAQSIACQKFEKQLVHTLENYDIDTLKTFRKVLDSLNNCHLTMKKSDKGQYSLFTLRNNYSHWNYVLKDKKVINKSERAAAYFYDIYELPDNEYWGNYLLIKRADEMSYTCYEAGIYNNMTSADHIAGNNFLTVCSWTHIDLSFPGKPDPATGLPTVTGPGIAYYAPVEIKFNPKNKLISYSFTSQNNGKQITRKAKYKKGTFKIKSYDARTFEE